MEDGSPEDSSLTVVPGDTAPLCRAFGHIREMKTKKRRFFVLNSMPRVWDTDGTKAQQAGHFLYVYKNKSYYEKNASKRIYDVSNVIFLSRCTSKANKTVLGLCFEEDALYLKFKDEEELSRWYFHLNEAWSETRNSLWPEVRHCFSVTLKNKDLATAGSKHGKPDMSGQYRFCMTDHGVLLVKDNLMNPVLELPYQCIRSCMHTKTSNVFQLHLGRLSPIGEGILHFEPEPSSMLKEIIETLVTRLSDGSSRDPDCTKPEKLRSSTKSRRQSKDASDAAQRPASVYSCVQQRSRGDSRSVIADATACPQCEAVCSCENYCTMSAGPSVVNSRSPNSSMSLSTNSSSVAHQPTATAGSEVSDEDESRLDRVSSWRYESLDSSEMSCGVDGDSVSSLGARANSIGSRPVRRAGSYISPPSCQAAGAGHQCGHRDNKNVFVEVSFQRPRTTSDASKHRHFAAALFRPRARSHGNRFLTNCTHCAAQLQHPHHQQDQQQQQQQQQQQEERPSSSTELRSCGQAATEHEDSYVLMAPVPRHQPERTAEEDPYWRPPGHLDAIVAPPSPAIAACEDYVAMGSAT